VTELDHNAIREAFAEVDIYDAIFKGIALSMPNVEQILNAIADGVKEAVAEHLRRNGLSGVTR
jgi:hypothetical protein